LNQKLEQIFKFFEEDLPAHYGKDEIRISQVQMAVDILAFLSRTCDKKTLLVHAPVGLGKTFAASMPSCIDIKNNNTRLIYSTSSLNLQAQLKNEELKILQDMGLINNYIIAKGVNHYVCYKRVEYAYIPDRLKQELLEYSLSSMEGDRVEFERDCHPISDDNWEKVNLTSMGACRNCKHRLYCSTFSHRRKFNNPDSKVVVTNHNQLIQSVINDLTDREPIIDYNNPGGIIIIDEAHDFEDAVLNQLSEELSLSTLQEAICYISENKTYRNIISHQRAIRDELYQRKKELETTTGRYQFSRNIINALTEINKAFKNKISEDIAKSANKISYTDDYGYLENISERIDKILNINEYTSWFDFENDSIVVVSLKFRENIKKIIEKLTLHNKVIFMSGTLAVNGSFDSVYYSFGGHPPKHCEKIYDTVFDLRKQAIVYVPKKIPKPISTLDPKFENYCRDLSKEITKLINITGGRTLILCTSHKQLNILYNYIKPDLEKSGITFLKQGEKSIELLTEDFKKDEASVLIGTGSFFAGLSVKKKALISVILCRLPFLPPDDPFVDLIANGLSSKEKMEIINFPRMLIRLMQAGGRLIRTIEDFGCFTILDPRVFESSYSNKIISELKNSGYEKITQDIDEVNNFILSRMSEENIAKYPEYSRILISIPDVLNRESNLYNSYSRNLYTVEKSNDIKTLKESISIEQEKYYAKLRKQAKLPQKLLKTIDEPYKLFEYIMNLNMEKNLNESVIDNFPFNSEEQKKIFIDRYNYNQQRKNSEIKTYYLSKEELEKYLVEKK